MRYPGESNSQKQKEGWVPGAAGLRDEELVFNGDKASGLQDEEGHEDGWWSCFHKIINVLYTTELYT